MNVHASPSPPTAVVDTVVVPTTSPADVANVIVATVSVGVTGSSLLIFSTNTTLPPVDPNGT